MSAFANIGPQDHLLTDLNDALDRAGLGHKIVAENQGGVLRLVAIDPAITGFTLGGTFDPTTNYVPRDLKTYSPDLWAKLGVGAITLEEIGRAHV